jgi:hypothetical protein
MYVITDGRVRGSPPFSLRLRAVESSRGAPPRRAARDAALASGVWAEG